MRILAIILPLGAKKTNDFKFNTEKGFAKPIYILFGGQCGNAMPLELPFSKVTLFLGEVFCLYRDRRFIERIGIKPDVYVPNGQDGVEFIVKRST